jgi:hypothetical protein
MSFFEKLLSALFASRKERTPSDEGTKGASRKERTPSDEGTKGEGTKGALIYHVVVRVISDGKKNSLPQEETNLYFSKYRHRHPHDT